MDHDPTNDFECPATHRGCDVKPALPGIQDALRNIAARMDTIDNRLDRASIAALEAKSLAEQTRTYSDAVSKTLLDHGNAIAEQSKLLTAQTSTLAHHGQLLDGQIKELMSLSGAIRALAESEAIRAAREETLAQYAREQRDWIRWGVPFAFTLLSAMIGSVIWIALRK